MLVYFSIPPESARLFGDARQIEEIWHAELVEVARLINRNAESCTKEMSQRNSLRTDRNLLHIRNHLRETFLSQFAKRWKRVRRSAKELLKNSVDTSDEAGCTYGSKKLKHDLKSCSTK